MLHLGCLVDWLGGGASNWKCAKSITCLIILFALLSRFFLAHPSRSRRTVFRFHTPHHTATHNTPSRGIFHIQVHVGFMVVRIAAVSPCFSKPMTLTSNTSLNRAYHPTSCSLTPRTSPTTRLDRKNASTTLCIKGLSPALRLPAHHPFRKPSSPTPPHSTPPPTNRP